MTFKLKTLTASMLLAAPLALASLSSMAMDKITLKLAHNLV